MTQPFDEKDVLFRFPPSEEEQEQYAIAEEYVLATICDEMLMFRRINGDWQQWYFYGIFFAHMLTEREAMQQRETALEHAIIGINLTLEKVESERDQYRAVLEEYAREESWCTDSEEQLTWWDCETEGPDLARAALKKGE